VLSSVLWSARESVDRDVRDRLDAWIKTTFATAAHATGMVGRARFLAAMVAMAAIRHCSTRHARSPLIRQSARICGFR